MSDLDDEEIKATKENNLGKEDGISKNFVSKKELKEIFNKYALEDFDGGIAINRDGACKATLEIINLIGGLDV